jgi:hypothetical protein
MNLVGHEVSNLRGSWKPMAELEGDTPSNPYAVKFRFVEQCGTSALYRRITPGERDPGLDIGTESNPMTLKRLNHLLQTHTLDLHKLFQVCKLGPWKDNKDVGRSKDPLSDLLRSLAALQLVYEEIPEATISPHSVGCQILNSLWLDSVVKSQSGQRSSYTTSRWELRKVLNTSAYSISRSQAFAAICMLESGSLNIDPSDLQRVFAVSSGDSLYIAAPLLCDPGTETEAYSIRRVIGNVGRAGITLVIPTTTSEIRDANPENWKLINHDEFDGQLEDVFQSTSLHFRFTGYELPVNIGAHGSRFTEVSFAEAVISVHDSGRWVADIEVIESLNSGYLHRLRQFHTCKPGPAGLKPDLEMTAIENWEEILDPPSTTAVFKTHGNWQARLAAVCINVKLGNNIILFQNHGCWACANRSMLRLEHHEQRSLTERKVVIIL